MLNPFKLNKEIRFYTERPPISSGIFWLVGFFAFINVYPIQAVLPLIRAEFSSSIIITGLLVGITLFAVACLSPFIGIISDRIGRKNVICTCLMLMAIPNALIAVSDSLNLLLVLRFVQGLLLPGIVVVTMAYMGEEVPPTQITRATSAYVSGTVMGGFAGRFITGYVASFTGNWRAGYVLIAVFIVFGAICVIKHLPNSRNFSPQTNIKQSLQTLKSHLHDTGLLAACMVGFCVLFALTSSFTYIAYLLQAPPFSLSTAAFTNIFTVYLFGAFVTSASSKFTTRIGKPRTILIFTLISISGLLATLMPNIYGVIIGITIFSSGMFVCQATSIGYLASHVKQGRSLATGLYNLSYYTGGGVGSLLSGLANEHYHWPGTVSIVVCVQLLAIIIATVFWKPEASAPPPDNADAPPDGEEKPKAHDIP